MASFQLKFEWEASPAVRAPELAATWARLEIRMGQDVLTKVEALRTHSLRDGIYVPLFPIAEWMVSNWWFLWNEWRKDGSGANRHSLLAAREGFPLPNLELWPTEDLVELNVKASAVDNPGLVFLSNATAWLPKQDVLNEFRRLIDSVLERLTEANLVGSHLFQFWNAIQDAEAGHDTNLFCQNAARLGFNPFEIDNDSAAGLEQLAAMLPLEVLADFCDAANPMSFAGQASSIQRFLDEARAQQSPSSDWSNIRSQFNEPAGFAPWQSGYQAASRLRSLLHIKDPLPQDLEEFLSQKLGNVSTSSLTASSPVDAISTSDESANPVIGLREFSRRDQKRFAFCRAIADNLRSPKASLITRGRSQHQQFNRAFAAEFLAPSDVLRHRISSRYISQEEISELADEFYVSDWVIQHQVQNHQLAQLAS